MQNLKNPVAIAEWIHLFPSRTQSLSTHTSKVLGWRRPGRIESCWFNSKTPAHAGVFLLSEMKSGERWKSSPRFAICGRQSRRISVA